MAAVAFPAVAALFWLILFYSFSVSSELEFAPDDETQARQREVQIVVNVLEPDPAYQPLILTDGASVFEVTLDDEGEIRRKLTNYIGQPFDLELSQPLWTLVDNMRLAFPGWPDDWSPGAVQQADTPDGAMRRR